MDKQQAQNIIKETFESPFDKGRFTGFVKNLLNHIDESKSFPKPLTGSYIKESFRERIKSYDRIGRFIDASGKVIDILTVCLHREKSLAQARTSQRNFISGYLRGDYGSSSSKDAAIVAFYCEDTTDWRFSLVTIEHVFDDEKFKVKQEFSSAKRFSFLVGENESSHTAQSRLVPILADVDNNPTLGELEEAFNIEKVTKEFFKKYYDLYLEAQKALDEIVEKDKKIKTDFTENDVSTTDFAKKLLGQIVFLYFLQKKGWFGVKRGKEWGTGSKHFLRELFQKKHGEYKNFFNDILEPLFYNTLAVERPKDYSDRFDCKIPFLNGGLFDPISDYDWIETEIYLHNDLFSNEIKTKDGDIGTGILDVFDRYNFTVKEDEPLEKEVAVDPEMLGKVFENLLELKDRKSKGTYYTPREIVHYMCKESLINYLISDLDNKVSKEEIIQLIKYGETAVEHDRRVVNEGRETDTYSFKLPENIRDNAKLIDEKLENIRVCDPAIGSGAFPVGMMSEIIRARNALTTYIDGEDNRTMYNFKRHAIHNCLYGVDIDPGAVEIAKLRLWLSLMVDEEDIKHIKPLPNLDYKIMQGNSLLEEFEGVKLFDEKLISYKTFDEEQVREIKEKQAKLQKELIELHNAGKLTKTKKAQLESEQSQLSAAMKKLAQPKKDSDQKSIVYEALAGELAKKLKKLHEEFFDAYHKSIKDQIRKQIDELEWELIETTLKEHKNEKALAKLAKFKRANTKPFFLWKLNFSEVFQEKGGFDVVIGNPPYFNISTINKDFFNQLSERYKIIHTGYNDIVYYFIYLGIEILRTTGCCVFITSNYYLGNDYAKKLRAYLKNHIQKILNFKEHMVFAEASVHTCISLSNKEANSDEVLFFEAVTDEKITSSDIEAQLRSFAIKRSELNDAWLMADQSASSIIDKLNKDSILLGDIATIEQGSKSGKNNVFTISSDVAKQKKFEQELLRKNLKNSDIDRYAIRDRGNYLIYVDNHTEIQNFPKIYSYLNSYKDALKIRNEVVNGLYPWYRFDRPRNKAIFDAKEKIVVPYRAESNRFAYDDVQYFNDGGDIRAIVVNDSTMNIKYVLALLNSRLIDWFYGFIGKPKGKVREYFNKPLSLIPIKRISLTEQQPIVTLVNQILTAKKKDPNADTSSLEKQIDEMVYALYGLTPEEIAIVEGEGVRK